jgi:beta-glucanase (GH16 family)
MLKGLAAGAGAAALGSGTAVPLPPAAAENGYRLAKDWDFARGIRTQAALRAEFFTRYIYDQGRLDYLNDEWQRYRDNANHVFVDGALALVARLPEGARLAPGSIESGMLRSRWSGRFGYYEARMKVPPGRGLWPAFWLNPQDGKWPPEIDVVEIVNNGRDTTANSFHLLRSGSGEPLPATHSLLDRWGSFRPGRDYKDAYADFAVEWTAERVRHFVDGRLVADRPFRWRHKDGSDGGPAHVLLNLAVGGSWPEAPNEASLPARLLVKHVRVWQR